MARKRATWTDGETTVTGEWEFYWPSDAFYIYLDAKDPITGRTRSFTTHGDTPDWGKFKRVVDVDAQ